MRAYLAMIVVVLIQFAADGAAAQQSDENPFDFSKREGLMKETGLPSVEMVTQLEASARALFDSGDCKKAIPALERYAKTANHLANLISAGVRPFYGASYDDRRGFSGISELVRFETAANEYKAKRNASLVMQAECHAKIGDPSKAAVIYSSALELIDIDDTALWRRAREGLYSVIGFK